MAAPKLSDIGMIELLECDPRPTFILDLERAQPPYHGLLHPVFSNASLQRLPRILLPVRIGEDVTADDDELEQHLDFREWATRLPTRGDIANGHSLPFDYHNLSWTSLTLRERWRIISGSTNGLRDTSAGALPDRPAGSQKDCQGLDNASRDSRAYEEKEKRQAGAYPTWVDDLPTSEHIQIFKSIDWSATALGPLGTWSDCLRQMTRLLMSDCRAASMYWYECRFESLHDCC